MDRTLFQKEIGEKLRNARKSRGLTMEQTARVLGLSSSYLGLVERGERCLSSQKIVRFCNLFGVSPEYILIGGDAGNNNFSSKKDSILAEISGMSEYDLNILLNIVRSYKLAINDKFPYGTCGG